MPNYHAYLSEGDLIPEAVLVVTGGTLPVDLQASDRLVIDCPPDRRIDALVLERGDGTMLIAIAEGRSVALQMAAPQRFEDLSLSSGFSRQCWVVL